MSEHPLDPIFHPRSVALFGAPADPDAWGSMFYRALIGSGYDKSRMFLINPKADRIAGLPAYKTLTDVPDVVDHVISSVPARVVPELVNQCIAKGIRSLHLFTAGFSETGDAEMARMETETVTRLKAAGIRTIGPNCLGLYVPASGMTFSEDFPKEPGNVFLISQSGANASEIVRSLAARGVRFSKVVSFGNGADLQAHDFFDYAASDPDTEVVISYLEGVPEGRKLQASLARCAAAKPTIILKGGLSGAGARAANSHTASLAGSREVFNALCLQTGTMRVDSMEELQDLTVAITTAAKSARGGRVVLVGGPGGFAVLSSDTIAAEGLELPETPAEAKTALRAFIPVAGTSVNNPIDASPRSNDEMERMIRTVCESKSFDVVFSTFLAIEPGGRFGRRAGRNGTASPEERAAELQRAREGAEIVGRLQRELGLPILYIHRREEGEDPGPVATAAFAEGVAVFPSVQRAARTTRQLLEWRESRAGLPDL